MPSPVNSPTFDELREALRLSLRRLLGADSYLLTNQVSEWSLAHRLAVYLEQHLPGWHVDCEYNREGDRPKRHEGRRVRPDIVVHRRGPEGPNLLAIELKRQGESQGLDQEKARGYLVEQKYRWAACVCVSKDEPAIEWFASALSWEAVCRSNGCATRQELEQDFAEGKRLTAVVREGLEGVE